MKGMIDVDKMINMIQDECIALAYKRTNDIDVQGKVIRLDIDHRELIKNIRHKLIEEELL